MPESSIDVRTAEDEDLRAIVSHYGPGGGDSPWDPFADLDRIRRIPREGLLVALDGRTYAGFLYWYEARKPWYDPAVERCARISDLHIVPAHQGQGIGRRLLSETLRRIREKEIRIIYLETDENNARAQRLYESAGFASFDRVVRYRVSLGAP